MRRTLTTLALSAVVLLGTVVSGPSGSAQAPNGCPYPPNNPVLSGRAGPPGPKQPREEFSIGGYLTQNKCGIAGRKVGLFARFSGSIGRYTYLKETVTGSSGQYGLQTGGYRSLEYILVFSGDRSFPRVVSEPFTVAVLAAPAG